MNGKHGVARLIVAMRTLPTDRRGNVLAMAAAAVVPMMAMIGGAIDLSRLYMTNTRLQQACDAGALAGRKAMADVNTMSDAEKRIARKYFTFNFPNNTYAAGTPTATYARGAVGTVAGTASIAVPMTIMKIFGYTTITLNVSCQSTLVVPNTDVMFVLDVTGSMADIPFGDVQSKIAGLKQAVKDFYGALGPGSTSGPGRVRYGFMPYSSNVNVGKIVYALNPTYIAGGTGSEVWHYQSRRAATTPDGAPYISGYGDETRPATGASTDSDIVWTSQWTRQTTGVGGSAPLYQTILRSDCSTRPVPDPVPLTNGSPSAATHVSDSTPVYPATTQTRTYATTQAKTVRVYQYAWTATFLFWGDCQLQYRDGTLTTTTTSTTTRPVIWATRDRFSSWVYENRQDINVSAVVQQGIAPNPAYYSGYYTGTDPNGGAPATITWGGCIEEASTISSITATSDLSVPSNANDLNIDLIPNSIDTKWKPFLREIQYDRAGNWLGRGSGWIDSGFAACPREASPLSQYVLDYVPLTKSSLNFNAYVDSLTPIGGTYHDIGLIWGARFLSPDGIYAATNADTTGPGGFQISRHIVFMTDGELDTKPNANDPWGINTLDGRIAPTGTGETALEAIHRRRTSIICNAMKGKGFTIWVVGFGIDTMPQELQDCASDAAHWSLSSNSTQLRNRFQQIAQTIGGLRLSQ
jgi:Flp pilus assembly protein TadG